MILAIVSSCLQGSVCLTSKGKILAEERWQGPTPAGEPVMPAIHRVLKKSGANLGEIDAIALDKGPGRFTGVRVAVSAVRGFAFSLNKPILAFSSLEILASQISQSLDHDQGPVLCLMDAHKNSMYMGVYHFSQGQISEVIKPKIILPQDIDNSIHTKHLCLGNGFEKYFSYFSTETLQNLVRRPKYFDFPTAQTLGWLASQHLHKRDQKIQWNQLIPLYIRASEAEEKLGTTGSLI